MRLLTLLARTSLLLCALTLIPHIENAHAGEKAAPTALRFRLTADPATLDWNLARSSHETYIIMNLMEGLVEEGTDLKPRPALAERWEVSSDGRTYTFFLRPGVKWSDGVPLKAGDFVDSWLRLLSPKTKSSYASFLFEVENAEAYHAGKLKDAAEVGVKAVGDSKLQVRLRRSLPYFIHIPTFWVTFPIRADVIKKQGARWAEPGKAVTLGPYLLKEWKKGKHIRLVRNPAYFGSPPSIEQADAVIEPNDKTARALFGDGKLDLFLDPTTADLVKFKSSVPAPAVRAQQFSYLATYYLGFNTRLAPLSDPAIRKAIALAIDRESIPSALQSGQLPAKGWVPPGIEGHDSAIQVPGSLRDARGALAGAGFLEGRGFPKLSLWIEKFDGAEEMGVLIARTLREKLGIEIETKVEEPEKYLRLLRSGRAALFVNHWGADFADPASFFEVFLSRSGTNSTGWSNPEYDKLVTDASGMLDPKARMESYASAEKILLQREVAVVPLFYKRNTVLLGARVQDFQISPLNYLFLKSVTLR